MAQYTPHQPLATPTAQEFGFPYTPYGIQEQLMQEVFQVLENRKIGIFESPTGTGKSLTLTCGALTWLARHEDLVRSEMLARIRRVQLEVVKLEQDGKQARDWLESQGNCRLQEEELRKLQHLQGLLDQQEHQLAEIRKRAKIHKKQRREEHPPKPEDLDKDLESNSDSDSEHETADGPQGTSEDRYRPVQIFFCSRTHSQLTQIVAELRKTPHAQSVRCISLGSRQQLCGNPQVRSLRQVGLMNERCLEMASQKAQPNPSKKSRLTAGAGSRCPFKAPSLVESLRDLALTEPMDIEELASEGVACGACSYYASRSALEQAQLILLPYQLLLQKSARNQLGINLKGSIVIVDEAHNLLDTLAQLHGAEINRQQLERAKLEISGYKEHFQKRFSTKNLLKINQLIFIVRQLLKMLDRDEDRAQLHTSRMLRTYELTAEGDFFNIDLSELLDFCARTRFARKVQGHAVKMQREPRHSENQPPVSSARSQILQRLASEQKQKEQPKQPVKRKLEIFQEKVKEPTKIPVLEVIPSPVRPLLAFLGTLTSNAEDGRILLDSQEGTVKYILLDPAEQFADIVGEARAIVIAGGTMQPTQELKEQLFASCQDRLVERFYSHVVPDDAVLPFVVSNGPKGAPLCFKFAQRASIEMLQELSMILQNLCQVIPGGVVCFLPSYEYLDKVYKHLEQSSALERIARKKSVFREVSGSADQLLEKYAAAIKVSSGSGGALLLSVVGGKLSEGLNFADDLGRAVLVVGLPYPNRQSPELQQRMRHLDEKLGFGCGNEFYENLCLKAVNQCIGRAVRHINDYACVYLLDERFANPRIQRKLPEWISRHIVQASTGKGGFGAVQAQTARFFKSR
ncbi:LOW QUALITY PROTEIN: ATP-dependent DNA helicase DDX11 [Drosophila takahashii]|uniref:LOW QUALITY PROTEIN: ATP-dependent DNA helicase DDX11 n=1 Tax=Drosophila takahashii TaxID=29030 RepID=UPI001CF8E73B|nr:ATP-dependent DNA helicase DDX11 [Drosophila takahashii]